MHFIVSGLSGKYGGTDTLSKYCLYVVYSIFSDKSNTADLPEVLWQDFWKFAIKRKPNDISNPRFWALTIQQLYREMSEPILMDTIPREVFVSFKTIRHYRIPDQTSFGKIRRLLEHMLVILPSRSNHLKHHMKTSIVYRPTQSALGPVEPTLEVAKTVPSSGKKKKSAKRKSSPSNPKANKRTKVGSSSQ